MEREVLLYLEEIGWSDLIDNRWRDELVWDIIAKFPDIPETTLDNVLNLVLV